MRNNQEALRIILRGFLFHAKAQSKAKGQRNNLCPFCIFSLRLCVKFIFSWVLLSSPLLF